MAKDKPARGLAAKAYAVAGGKISPPSGTGHTGKRAAFANDAGTELTDDDGWVVFSTTTVSSPATYVTVTGLPTSGYSEVMIELYNLKHNEGSVKNLRLEFSRVGSAAYIGVSVYAFTNSDYIYGAVHFPSYRSDSGFFRMSAKNTSSDAAFTCDIDSGNVTVPYIALGGIDDIRVGFSGVSPIQSGRVIVKVR